jgi:hypothetical protein
VAVEGVADVADVEGAEKASQCRRHSQGACPCLELQEQEGQSACIVPQGWDPLRRERQVLSPEHVGRQTVPPEVAEEPCVHTT